VPWDFQFSPIVSNSMVVRGRSKWPKYVFGHQRDVQPYLRKATQNRAVIRFVGPSGFPKDDKTVYKERVSKILEEIADGLNSYKRKIEINTGASAVGLDAMLSEQFFGKFPASGVVSWLLPKIICNY
jgi:hypothetical protein